MLSLGGFVEDAIEDKKRSSGLRLPTLSGLTPGVVKRMHSHVDNWKEESA